MPGDDGPVEHFHLAVQLAASTAAKLTAGACNVDPFALRASAHCSRPPLALGRAGAYQSGGATAAANAAALNDDCSPWVSTQTLSRSAASASGTAPTAAAAPSASAWAASKGGAGGGSGAGGGGGARGGAGTGGGGATSCGAASSAAADDAASRAAAIKRRRCGECEGCTRGNCGECASCADMPRFGGQGSSRQACVGRRCLKMESCVLAMDADGNVLRMPPRMPSTEDEERVSAQQLAALHSFVRQLGGAADLLDGWYAKTETRRQGTSAGSTDTCACPLLSRPPPCSFSSHLRPSLPWQLLFSRVGQKVSISDRGCALARAGHHGTTAEAKETEGGSLRDLVDDGRGTAVWRGEPYWRGRPGRTCQGLAADDSPSRRGGGRARLKVRVMSSALHLCSVYADTSCIRAKSRTPLSWSKR